MVDTDPCIQEALRLYSMGMDEDDFVKMITGRMCINEARAKLQFSPLNDPVHEKLFFVEPTSIIPGLKRSTIHKAAERWQAVEAKLYADILQTIMEERHSAVRKFLQEGVIDQDTAKLLLAY